MKALWGRVSARPEFITIGLIVLLVLGVSLLEPRFFSPQNLVATIRTTTRLGIFALGVLLVFVALGLSKAHFLGQGVGAVLLLKKPLVGLVIGRRGVGGAFLLGGQVAVEVGQVGSGGR